MLSTFTNPVAKPFLSETNITGLHSEIARLERLIAEKMKISS
jgi:hypothetical protein